MNFPSLEFDNAVASLCDGTISDERLAELHDLLHTAADARDEYLWRVEVHGLLAAGHLESGCSAKANESDIDGDAHAPPPLPLIVKNRWAASSIITAVTLFVVVLAGGLWLRQNLRLTEADSQLVATFTDLQDSRWMDPTTQVSSGDAIRVGQRIELSAGAAEVLFSTGAKLRIVGPTIVEPRTDNSVFLTLGEVHLIAETPESKGFTVVTPTSKFVDISTAFSAGVSPDGLSRLNVSEGEVDVFLEGTERTPRLRAGETLYVEPGERQVMTRIEEGDGTAEFRFPTIQPPSHEDLADEALGRAEIRVIRGRLNFKPGGGSSGPASVLIDGVGQSRQDAPNESAFLVDGTSGCILIDLGSPLAIGKINSYSWHQHEQDKSHRYRARQRFTLYGFSGDQIPDSKASPEESGWTRIARVNSDQFFQVADPLDRPAQQAASITAAQGEIGCFRYLLWEVNGNTFFGELDVFESPASGAKSNLSTISH